MYRVETHNNSKEYYESLQIERDAIYITPTTNFAYMISEVSNLKECDRWRFVDIDALIKLVYKKKSNNLNKIKLKNEIRLIIDEFLNSNNNLELIRVFKYLNDNIEILTSDIERFIDAKITSLKYEKETETDEKRAIALIYNKLTATKIYKEFIDEILNVESAKGFYRGIEGFDGSSISKIYVYNLNNLGLNRWLLLNMFKYAGFEIVFRIPYFKGLRVANKCWENLYLQSDIFQINYDESFKGKNYFDYKFVRFLEGLEYNEDTLIDEKVVTKTYSQINDFKKDIRDKKIITFYKDSIKACQSRNSEEGGYKLEHCFQSAIGKFLSNLYRCKVTEDIIKLDFNTYRELITSGWIEDSHGWNGVKLREYLSKNEEYFSSVEDIDEILKRLYALKDLTEVNHIFEDHSKNKIKDDNQKKLLLNPLRILGYNNTEDYGITVNYMIQLTIKLKGVIFRTLGGSNIIEVTKHLNILKEVFKNKYTLGKNKTGTDEEKLITKKIWWMLNKEEIFEEKMHRDEILEIISTVLKIKNTEQIEEADLSIDHLESVIYRKKRVGQDEKKKIILTDLSYKNYEKYVSERTIDEKILNKEDITEIFSNSLIGAHKKIVLEADKLNNISNTNVDVYLKFLFANLFINFDGIKELSWIEGIRENDTQSIILKQIEAIYGNEIKGVQGLDFDDIVAEENIELQNIKSYDITELEKDYDKYADIAYRNLDFCNRKFLYASVLSDYPVYYSNFHNKLVFSGLVSILKNSIEDSYTNIIKFIFPLFPQWKDVVKSNILLCEYARKNIRDYKYFDGINYPKNIDSLYLLKSKYIVGENSKIRNRYNKENFKAREYYKDFITEYLYDEEINSGKHCMMCPYIYICKKGEFIIDNK